MTEGYIAVLKTIFGADWAEGAVMTKRWSSVIERERARDAHGFNIQSRAKT